MSVQTAVSNDPAAAYEGALSEFNPFGGDRITKIAQVALAAGLGVCQGTADDQCTALAASTDVTGLPFLGVTIYDPSKDVAWPPGTTVPYPIGQAVSIMRKGRVWVWTEEAVTPASTPYCRYAAGAGGTVIGRFRASADTATAAAVPGARFMTTAGAGSLVLLEIE